MAGRHGGRASPYISGSDGGPGSGPQPKFGVGAKVSVPGAKNLSHSEGTVSKVHPSGKYQVTHGGPKKHQQTNREYHEFELDHPKKPGWGV